jgi:hypothetical protein
MCRSPTCRQQLRLAWMEKGVYVGFADGAVWFLRRDMPLDGLERFFTINGAGGNDRDVCPISHNLGSV